MTCQRIQKLIRGALILLPMPVIVVAMLEWTASKSWGFIGMMALLSLGCAGCFCLTYDKGMFQRMAMAYGLGAVVFAANLITMDLPVNGINLLSIICLGTGFILSLIYAVGRKNWNFM